MKISLIAAIGAKNELGYGNNLIWKIPNDLKRFKEKTLGHPIIMGRKTFESIGRLLPDRTNIIITRDQNYKSEGAIVVHSLDEALRESQGKQGEEETFIIGGGQIFSEAISKADKLYLTLINSSAPMADVFFPDYSEFKKETFRESHEEDGLQYQFVDLVR